MKCILPQSATHLKRNEALSVVEQADLNSAAAFDLYRRYVDKRHQGGDMFPATDEQFEAFIKTKPSTRVFTHFTKIKG